MSEEEIIENNKNLESFNDDYDAPKNAELKRKYNLNKSLNFETYSEYLIKANSRDRGKDKWIFEVLNGKNESDRIIYKDDKFIMFPPRRCDNEDLTKFHMLSFVTDESIRSIRDLTDDHVDLLKHIYTKSIDVIFKKYGIHENKLRAYIHYHPTTWLLHVHFNLISNGDTASSVEYSYSVHDVIQNLMINGNYYRLITMKVLMSSNT